MMGRVTVPFFRYWATRIGHQIHCAEGSTRDVPALTMKQAIRPKARELFDQTWQSQANLAVFLLLLVVTIFVLPALTLRHEHIVLYGNIVPASRLSRSLAIGGAITGNFTWPS